MHENIIESAGLTKGEAKVYGTLLKTGETTTGKIIDESGLSSGKIYEILDKLMRKGLATYIIKEKTKYFSATHPRKLLEYVDSKKRDIETTKKEIENILPQLVGFYNNTKSSESAVIYKGIEGLKTAILDEMENLEKDDEYLSFGVSQNRTEQILRFWTKFENVRLQKKIKAKYLIVNKNIYDELFKKSAHTEVRSSNNSESGPILLFKNTVIIFDWDNLTLIKITNENIAKSFKEFFNSLWNTSTKIK